MILTEKKLEYFFHRIPISSRQASILRQVIHQLATIRARKERYSHPVQKHYAEVYNHFKSYFNLSKYSNLPSKKYKDGLAFLNKWLMKEEQRGDLL